MADDGVGTEARLPVRAGALARYLQSRTGIAGITYHRSQRSVISMPEPFELRVTIGAKLTEMCRHVALEDGDKILAQNPDGRPVEQMPVVMTVRTFAPILRDAMEYRRLKGLTDE